MTRISKPADERKNEIIERSIDLFIKSGIDQTSVSQIINEVGIAKGTFYYYFDSKERLVEECMISIAKFYTGEVFSDLCEKCGADVKIQKVLDNMVNMDKQGEKIIEYIHKPENLKLHTLISREITKVSYERLLPVVIEGMEDGVFGIEYPDKTLYVLLQFLFSSSHDCVCEDMFSLNDWKAEEVEYFINLILKTKPENPIRVGQEFEWSNE